MAKYCRLIPCFVGEGALSASSVAKLFFDNIAKFFGIPAEVISDKDPRFTAFFLVESMVSAEYQASDEFFLPSLDQWADGDSQDLGADPELFTA